MNWRTSTTSLRNNQKGMTIQSSILYYIPLVHNLKLSNILLHYNWLIFFMYIFKWSNVNFFCFKFLFHLCIPQSSRCLIIHSHFTFNICQSVWFACFIMYTQCVFLCIISMKLMAVLLDIHQEGNISML